MNFLKVGGEKLQLFFFPKDQHFSQVILKEKKKKNNKLEKLNCINVDSLLETSFLSMYFRHMRHEKIYIHICMYEAVKKFSRV